MSNDVFNACVMFITACSLLLILGPGFVVSGYMLVTVPSRFICEVMHVGDVGEPLLIAISMAIAVGFGFLAHLKGKNFFKWFFLSLVFSVSAWLYVVGVMRKTDKVGSGDLIKAGQNLRELRNMPGKDFKDFKDI